MQAKEICPSDSFVHNELGVVAYHMKEYHKSIRWFDKTMTLIPSLSEIWEPTVVNLARSHRKVKMYREAISNYEKALTLSTRSMSTYAGIATLTICRKISRRQSSTTTMLCGSNLMMNSARKC